MFSDIEFEILKLEGLTNALEGELIEKIPAGAVAETSSGCNLFFVLYDQIEHLRTVVEKTRLVVEIEQRRLENRKSSGVS